MATRVLIDDMLTDEELAAMNEEETTTSETTEGETTEGETTEGETTEGETTEGETTEGETTEGETTEGETTIVDDVEAATLFELADPVVTVATPDVEEIEAHEDKIAELNESLEGLSAKVESGDMELVEYTRQYHKLSVELNAINTEVAVMRSQADQGAKAITAQWQADATSFIKANPVFSNKTNPALFGALNANIQEIASGDDADTMSNQDILREAAKRVHEQLRSIMPRQPKAKETPIKKKVDAKKKQVASGKTKKTLATAPASTSNTGKGEFSHLDSMEGKELEDAMSNLSPKQLDKYLAQ